MIRKNTLRTKPISAKLRRAYEAVMIEEDGIPLETNWHRAAIALLVEVMVWLYRGRDDYFAAGNMFIYYSLKQATEKKYRGPDFFLVKDVEGAARRDRRWWWVLEENMRYPNVIIELLSRSTARTDRTTKKKIYEETFCTPDYFCYDPDKEKLEGWHLTADRYEPLPPNEKGWLWCEEVGAWLGIWDGTYLDLQARWPRFFDVDGNLLPTAAEAARAQAEAEHQRAETEHQRAETEYQRAEAERQRAEAEHQRAEALAAELARLKAEQRKASRRKNGHE